MLVGITNHSVVSSDIGGVERVSGNPFCLDKKARLTIV
jgi:hypothetical protein